MDFEFNVVKVRLATKKHPDSAIVEVVCESKEILGLGVIKFGPLKGKLVIYYKEKKDAILDK